MSDRIRVGVIGVGQIGKSHLQRYRDIAGAEVVAIADVNEQELNRVGDEHGIDRRFTSFRDLLALDDIQSVDVCLHNNFHAPVTIAAMEAGKDVYCEKPMAGAYADALAMKEAADSLGRKLAIQLTTLFQKETKAARRLIQDGRLGRIYYARSCGFRRRGRPFVDGYGSPSFVQKKTAAGGALYDMGVYHIANVLYLMDNPEVVAISGQTFQELDMYEDRRTLSGYDVEEMAVALVRLQDEALLQIEECWASHQAGDESTKLLGAAGGIRLQPFAYFTSAADMELSASFDLNQADVRWHRCLENESAYDHPQSHWIAALRGRVPLIDSASVALNCMLISEGIYLSSQRGCEVTAEEVREASHSTAVTGL